MTRPATANIEIYRGDTFRLAAEAPLPAYAPIDPQQWVAKAQYKTTGGTTVVDFTPTLTAVDSNTALRIDLELTAAQTEAITNPGNWDLQITYPDGSIRTWLRGTVTVTDDVTT